MTETLTLIVKQLNLSCLIGIDDAEKHVPQQLLLDMTVQLNQAQQGDAQPVLGYDTLVQQMREHAQNTHYGLLENWLAAAADIVMQHPSAQQVKLYCRKPKLFADVEEAGVELVRTR